MKTTRRAFTIGADVVVRFFAEQLRQLARQPMIVENKPGASSSIALQAVARSKPDGYTLLIGPGNSLAAITSWKRMSN